MSDGFNGRRMTSSTVAFAFPERALADEARNIRLDIAEALHGISAGGHYGGCFSVVEILLALYRLALEVRPAEPDYPDRSRLILSKGHAALTLYAILHRLGFFAADLKSYASSASALEGHPDMISLPGIDFSTGSLGQGLSVAAGMALALQPRGIPVWAVLGDGECQEGQVWEAAMFASLYRLSNLRVVVDCNGFQECGWNFARPGPAIAPVPGMAAKWSSFGWKVIACDGHSFAELAHSFSTAAATDAQPAVILARTVKGKGASLIEEKPIRFHCTAVSREEHELIVTQLLAS